MDTNTQINSYNQHSFSYVGLNKQVGYAGQVLKLSKETQS